jgi:hypothetical protein
MGMDGEREVRGLKKQKEIMIEQPAEPFLNIKPLNDNGTKPEQDKPNPKIKALTCR